MQRTCEAELPEGAVPHCTVRNARDIVGAICWDFVRGDFVRRSALTRSCLTVYYSMGFMGRSSLRSASGGVTNSPNSCSRAQSAVNRWRLRLEVYGKSVVPYDIYRLLAHHIMGCVLPARDVPRRGTYLLVKHKQDSELVTCCARCRACQRLGTYIILFMFQLRRSGNLCNRVPGPRRGILASEPAGGCAVSAGLLSTTCDETGMRLPRKRVWRRK